MLCRLLTLLIAWFVPLICVVKPWLIARPAASSAALLMRRPDDKRVRDWDNKACEPPRLFCAVSESMLVFSVNAIYARLLIKVDVSPARLRPKLLCLLPTALSGPDR